MRASRSWSEIGVYLALETSGEVGSVALARGASVLAREFLPERSEQAALLQPAVSSVLEKARITPAEIDGLVVGSGPGSFTGVRVAAAAAKGMAHALDVPLWTASSLAGAALSDLVLPEGAGLEGWWSSASADQVGLRSILFDARGERVYAASYEVVDGRPEERIPPRVAHVGELLGAFTRPVAFAGSGALRHRSRIEAAGHRVLGPPAGFPTADALLRILATYPHAPPLADVAAWEPEYLQATSAERERDGR